MITKHGVGGGLAQAHGRLERMALRRGPELLVEHTKVETEGVIRAVTRHRQRHIDKEVQRGDCGGQPRLAPDDERSEASQ
jgi:hypothetical protein